jgi:hypothetical protein
MRERGILLPLTLLAVLLAAPPLRAADLKIDKLDLVTHGGMNSSTGLFEMSTRLALDLSFAGGDKFAGLIRMEMLSGTVEEDLATSGLSVSEVTGSDLTTGVNLDAAKIAAEFNHLVDAINSGLSLKFRSASVTARELFGLPFDTTYFVGRQDYFASGDDFVPLFGATPFTTELRGPMVYPEGVGGDPNLFYEGIHAVNGTGFKLATSTKLSTRMVGYFYLYQDSDIGAGSWSGDIRGLYNTDKVKLELFAGASATSTARYGIYRAGLMFFAAPGDVGEFFAQVGMPFFDPESGFTVDNLYVLFEPRINFDFGYLALSVFYHPLYYRQHLPRDYDALTGRSSEKSALDTSFDLRFGEISEQGVEGGFWSLLAFRPLTTTPLTVDIAPYYSVIAGGVQWDFKLDLRLFPFPGQWFGILRPFIGLRTSF